MSSSSSPKLTFENLDEYGEDQLNEAQHRSLRRTLSAGDSSLHPNLDLAADHVLSNLEGSSQDAIQSLSQILRRETNLPDFLERFLEQVPEEHRSRAQRAIQQGDTTLFRRVIMNPLIESNIALQQQQAAVWTARLNELSATVQPLVQEVTRLRIVNGELDGDLHTSGVETYNATLEAQHWQDQCNEQRQLVLEKERDKANTEEQLRNAVLKLHGAVTKQTMLENQVEGELNLAERELAERDARLEEMEELIDQFIQIFATPVGSASSTVTSTPSSSQDDLSIYDEETDQTRPNDNEPHPSFLQTLNPLMYDALIWFLFRDLILDPTKAERSIIKTHALQLADSYTVPLLVFLSAWSGLSIWRLQRTVPTSYLVFALIAMAGVYSTSSNTNNITVSPTRIFQDLDLNATRATFQYVRQNIAEVCTYKPRLAYIEPVLQIVEDIQLSPEEFTRPLIRGGTLTSNNPILPLTVQVGASLEIGKWKAVVGAILSTLVSFTATYGIFELTGSFTGDPMLETIQKGLQLVWNSPIPKYTLTFMVASMTNVLLTELPTTDFLFQQGIDLTQSSPLIIAGTAILLTGAKLTMAGKNMDELQGILRPTLNITAALFVMNVLMTALNLRDWMMKNNKKFRPLLSPEQGEVVELAGKYSLYLGMLSFGYVALTGMSVLPDTTKSEVWQWIIQTGVSSVGTYAMTRPLRRF